MVFIIFKNDMHCVVSRVVDWHTRCNKKNQLFNWCLRSGCWWSWETTRKSSSRTCGNKSKIAKRFHFFTSIIIEMWNVSLSSFTLFTPLQPVCCCHRFQIKASPVLALLQHENILRRFLCIVKVILIKTFLDTWNSSLCGLKWMKNQPLTQHTTRTRRVSYLLSFYDFKCESQ